MWLSIYQSRSRDPVCHVSRPGLHKAVRAPCTTRLPPDEARSTTWAKRNGYDAWVRCNHGVRSDKFHGKFQQGLLAAHLPDALRLSKTLRHKIRPWDRMEISAQELVGRIANTD